MRNKAGAYLCIPRTKDLLCITKRGDGRDSLGLPALLCASRQVPGCALAHHKEAWNFPCHSSPGVPSSPLYWGSPMQEALPTTHGKGTEGGIMLW